MLNGTRILLVEDDDQAETLDRKLKALQEEELPDLDDEISITDSARQKVADFIGKNVTAQQIANYLTAYGKGLPNPRVNQTNGNTIARPSRK